MKALLITVLALIGLSGCATSSTPRDQISLDSWVGAPVAEFFAHHREPDSVTDKSDYRLYVWETKKDSSTSTPISTSCTYSVDPTGRPRSPQCTNYGGDRRGSVGRCAWTLRVEGNVITEATLTGDDCAKDEHPIARTGAMPPVNTQASSNESR